MRETRKEVSDKVYDRISKKAAKVRRAPEELCTDKIIKEFSGQEGRPPETPETFMGRKLVIRACCLHLFFGLLAHSVLDLARVCWWTVQGRRSVLAFMQQPQYDIRVHEAGWPILDVLRHA